MLQDHLNTLDCVAFFFGFCLPREGLYLLLDVSLAIGTIGKDHGVALGVFVFLVKADAVGLLT